MKLGKECQAAGSEQLLNYSFSLLPLLPEMSQSACSVLGALLTCQERQPPLSCLSRKQQVTREQNITSKRGRAIGVVSVLFWLLMNIG